jgi:hypothetical protein
VASYIEAAPKKNWLKIMLLAELLNPPARVYDSLDARGKRMALRADINSDILSGRPSFKTFATSTSYSRDVELRMDIILQPLHLRGADLTVVFD